MKPTLKTSLLTALELLLLLSLVLTVLLPNSPASNPIPSRDSGVFLYTGWRILHGELPYVNVWDHKTPVIYYLDALGLALTPDSSWGVWFVEVASLWIAAALAYFLLKRLFDSSTAIFLAFLWLFTAFYMFDGGNLTTEYSLPFQFALLWLFYRAERAEIPPAVVDRGYGWHGFGLGVVTALLFFTRQNALGIPMAIAIYLVFNRIFTLQPQRLWRDAWPILVGGLLATALILGYFALHGALPAFWDQAIHYNFLYAGDRTDADRVGALTGAMKQLSNVGLAQLAITGWSAAVILLIFKGSRFPSADRVALWLVTLALPLELGLVSLGGRPRLPYYLTLVPVFTVCAGVVINLVFGTLLKDIPRLASAFALVLMVLGLWTTFQRDFNGLVTQAVDASQLQLAAYIRDNTSPNDTVLMWGAETSYNFAARRQSPTRFVYQYPLYRADYADKANVTEFLQDILIGKPRLIVIASNESLSDLHFGFRDYQIGGLMQSVKAHYGNPAPFGNWLIYTYTGQ